ncbi:MAG: nucleotidyltransferase domain-containing protein [Bacteroidetes bacterium]|nr:nucleotidyltransferase domain-containing protein [Bacteroidota bacterium]MBL6944402.1 nucleotidyltransferase domain-containing protein [Bacteroidales bacterium]
MRLSQNQIQTINQTAKEHFGNSARVFLFGSRVDNLKKGGDIDLLIKAQKKSLLTLKNKMLFLVDLKLKLGDRKIDVVFDIKDTFSDNFIKSIKKQSVELC